MRQQNFSSRVLVDMSQSTLITNSTRDFNTRGSMMVDGVDDECI